MNAGVCQNCFIKFNEYDEHFTIAEQIQNELTALFHENEASSNAPRDNKSNIKLEEFGNYDDAIDVMPEFCEIYLEDPIKKKLKGIEQFVSIIPTSTTSSAVVKQKPKIDTARKLSPRAPKRDRDEGFIVVYVDGEKRYQCDICSRLKKDRHKLKAHRQIHTNERNIMCQECGAKFRTMACLRNHRRLHRNIFYHCDLCTSKYKEKLTLRKHMVTQ